MGHTSAFTRIRACLEEIGIEGDALDSILDLVKRHAQPQRANGGPRGAGRASAGKSLGDIAAGFLQSSLRRKELIGRAGDDAAWNILLALFADQQRARAVSVSSACYASGAAQTTALRHIEALHRQGLILRNPDQFDGRRAYLELSKSANERMAQLIASFCVEAPARRSGERSEG